MNKVIIFENEFGGVTVGYPTPESLEEMSIQDIAVKDVPENCPFWIVDGDSLPADHSFFNAWELDKESLGDPDGVGSVKQ